ncbi:hypothetical protein [Pseudomonas viridiflava]|uniref:hypothetical protein n=1 Tax=Pseudomonas viridiflava TaxID=33069 RepID=UPI0013CE5326|nr:hypothetical protein [Pseudomonas viridiflava]
MGEANKHGLPRYISSEVKRAVRVKCGFGCVICGLAYYDYEHFAPDFKDARSHAVEGITLLCMQCNQKRARGTLSAKTVALADADPKCKQQGFASELFDIGSDPLNIRFAGSNYIDCGCLIHIAGVDVLSVRPPEQPGSPMLMSGAFSDSTGAVTLTIRENVFSVGGDSWDVEVVGPLITVRRGPGDIALQLRVNPPHGITVERINMEIEGVSLVGDESQLEMFKDKRLMANISSGTTIGCQYGIFVAG